MLPFSGITLQQNILKISELLPDLRWMDKRQYSAPCNPYHKQKSLSFVEIAFTHSRKLRYKKGKVYHVTVDPLDESLSFSPVMGVGCPGAV
jgi:hypothetical protein